MATHNYNSGEWDAVWGRHAGYDCMTPGWTFYFTDSDGVKREMFVVDERDHGGDWARDVQPDEDCKVFVQWMLGRLRGE